MTSRSTQSITPIAPLYDNLLSRNNKPKSTNQNIFYLNAESVLNNFEDMEVLVGQLKPAMIICSETCLTEQINDNEILMNGYNVYRCDSFSRHTGGVLIYIKSNIKSEVVLNKTYGKNVWCLSVHVKCCTLNGIYTAIYHSPNSSHADFMNYFEDIIEQCYDHTKLNVFVGDFNIDMSRNFTYSDKLNQIIRLHGMKQLMNVPTRITENSQTIIDLVISNDNSIVCKTRDDWKVSDHETIEIEINSSNEFENEVKRLITTWDRYNPDELALGLSGRDWSMWHSMDVHVKTKFLRNRIIEAVNKLVDIKSIKIKQKNKWYDHELCEMNKLKFELYKEACRARNFSDYQSVRSQYKKLIKIKKRKPMWKNE